MDSIITAIAAGFIGVILLTAVAPIMADQIADMTSKSTEISKYKPIFYLIPSVVGIGVIIGIFKLFSGGSR